MSQSTSLARKAAPLSADERTTLQQIETTLRQKMGSFLEVGNLLLQIRDEKLYREEYATFEAYLDERWDLGKSHGYRLIRAAKVANELPDDAPRPSSIREANGIKTAPADPVVTAKANGHIPHDAVVEVTEPEPSADSEPEPVPEETDADWLATLPARAKLSDRNREMFDAEALTYRACLDARDVYRRSCKPRIDSMKKALDNRIGPWLSKHYKHFREINDPADWQACAHCNGVGISPELKIVCPDCKGNGYHV